MCYGIPTGIMNDMWSANAPQLALFNWKIVTHVTNNTNQTAEPITEKMTSKTHNVTSCDTIMKINSQVIRSS